MPYIILLIIILLGIWAISIYNGLILIKHKVEESFSGIDIALKKRFDLITNLIEIVKGYT